MLQQPPVRGGLGVVELVDDDHLEVLRGQTLDAVRRQALDAGKDMPPPLRAAASDVQLAERAVGEDLAVGAEGLSEDLLAVGDEQQARSAG